MSKVVTLPIKPRLETSFLKLITPLVADFVARATKSSLTVMLNAKGIISPDKKKQILNYQKILKKIGIGNRNEFKVSDDYSSDYQEFFISQVHRLLECGLVEFVLKNILSCSCGKVEIPSDALEDAISHQKRKSIVFKNGEIYKCKLCNNILVNTVEEVVILKLKHIPSVKIYPEIFIEEVSAIQKWYSGYESVISRNHKGSFDGIEIAGKRIVFDSDFRWSLYLGYIAEKETDIYLVISGSSILHAIKVISLCSILFPKIKVRLIIHPLINVTDIYSDMSKLSINQYIKKYQDTDSVRSFLSLGLQWGHSRAKLISSDLYFIQKMNRIRKKYPYKYLGEIKDIRLFIKTINRANILSLFKKIYQKQILSMEETVTTGIIFND